MDNYSKYLSLKSAIEDVLGIDSWYALKESNHLPTWKKQLLKLISALHFSIKASVKIYDEDWLAQINEEVENGQKNIKCSKDIEEAISSLSAVLINISFLQVGFMPRRKGATGNFQLRKENWRLDKFRSVIYTQSNEQKETLFWFKQQQQLGFNSQMDLWAEYRRSNCKNSYSVWCKTHDTD